MQHFGRADAVEDLDAGGGEPGVERRLGQGLAGRHAFAQRGNVVRGELCQHRAIGRGCGESDRGAELGDGGEQVVRGCFFDEDRRRADAQRKQDEPAQPEGEGERRRADEAILRIGAQHVAPVTVAGRKHVAVEMHGALGLAGRARGEADEAHVVARRVAGDEGVVAGRCHQRFERIGRAAAPVDDALEIARQRAGILHLFGQAVIAEREADFGLGNRVGDLLGAQERHGRDHDGAGLDDGEIGRHHHRAVRPAQQHAMSGHDAERAREHVGDAVHPLGQLRVSQGFRRRDQARPVAAARRNPLVEQLNHAIHPFGIFQLRQLEQEIRPLRARGQVVAREGVEMRRRGHGCRSSPKSIIRNAPRRSSRYRHSAASADLPARFFNSSRAITTFCTSVAPS